MKKILFGVATMLLFASCSGNGSSEKAKEDSARIADSIAKVEAAKEASEQARLDSLRQDSITQEINMRLKPEVFRDFFNEKKMKKDLSALGFKLLKEEYDHEEEWDGYWAKYKRTMNGRTIEIEYGFDTSNSGSIKFSDKNDAEQFKKDLLNSGFKKDEYGYYNHKNLNANYPSFEISGRYVNFGYN